MPQFELDAVGPESVSGLFRGRTPEEAIGRALGEAAGGSVSIEEQEDLHGWRTVHLDSAPAGRVRPHQRMRFRRD